MTTLDSDLRELKRVLAVQRLLERPADIYEAKFMSCTGDCDEPVWVDPLLTCCAAKLLHDIVIDAQKLEKVVRKRILRATSGMPRVQNPRMDIINALELKRVLPRVHTGTFAGRMLREEEANELKKLREEFSHLLDNPEDAPEAKRKEG